MKTHKAEFKEVSIDEIATQIRLVNTKKASAVVSLPARILKENSDVFSVAIQVLFNWHMAKNTFPQELKAEDIKSPFKKEDACSK